MYLLMSGREAKDSEVNATKAVTLMSVSIPKGKSMFRHYADTNKFLPDGVKSKGNKDI